MLRLLLNLRIRLDIITADYVTEILFRYLIELHWHFLC